MGRRSAVAFHLVDTAFLSDPKFRALLRRLPDPDDFNSAVGAYFIALAAARRNGRATLDVRAETESRFVDVLQAVGLLLEDGFPPVAFEEWNAMSPQSIAGKARAASATRTPLGTYSSDTSALDTLAGLDQPSPLLPSPQIPSEENDVSARAENGHQERLDGPVAYYEATGKYPPLNSGLHDWVVRLASEYTPEAFQRALATELTINRGLKDLLSRTEARLIRAADEARPVPSDRAERTRRELDAEEQRRSRLLAQPMKPLRDLLPDVKLGKPS